MNIKKLIGGLLTKADATSNDYSKALEEKQQTLMQIQLQLKDEQMKLKEFHKLSLLKQITEETYTEQKEVVSKMVESIQSIQIEMKQIELYKTEDVESVLAEIQANKAEFNKKYQAEIQTVKLGIAEARQEYLEKLSLLGKQYNSAVREEGMIQQFMVDFGKQPNMYLPDKTELIGKGATVGIETVEQYINKI
jgi:ABC-type uncharacterized transport system permease subunit